MWPLRDLSTAMGAVFGEVPLDGLGEFDEGTRGEPPLHSRTRPLPVVSGCPYPFGCAPPMAHWLRAWMAEGSAPRTRTQLNYQKSEERAYREIAPPDPNVSEFILTDWLIYIPHIAAPPRVYFVRELPLRVARRRRNVGRPGTSGAVSHFGTVGHIFFSPGWARVQEPLRRTEI